MFFLNFLLWTRAMLAPFGSWESPITSDLIVTDSVSFFNMLPGEEGIYWTEVRPQEKGRFALVHYDGKETSLVDEVSVRTRVHEYGGGSFSVTKKQVIYSNDTDRQLYRLKEDGTSEKLTDHPSWRFADGDDVFWVCEKHDGTVENCIVYLSENGVKTVAAGHDFYASPRISPDGEYISFVTWDFPSMPWDESTLWVAKIADDGTVQEPKKVAGGNNSSICNVAWSPDGVLHYVSDQTGFWNLYRVLDDKSENLCPMEAEFGLPAWIFGRPTYAFLSDGRIICTYVVKGIDYLALLDPVSKSLTTLPLPFTSVHNVITLNDKVYFFGATPTDPLSIICLDPKTNKYEIIKESFKTSITKEWISEPEVLEYPTMDHTTGYAFYYPPKNPNFKAPQGEKPPLVVKCHGGPTARSYNHLSLDIQYWTSRGFAFLDVNYGGSTGYGRHYFKRLERNWGIIDVDDTIRAAQELAQRGLVDPKRMVIRGGSAGGYTALASVTFKDVFAAATSYYGVSDLILLYEDTHKFEAEYTDILVGSYPEEEALIKERSPITYVDQIKTPILLLQGTEDKIVLPNQATTIFEALKAKGIPTGLLMFEGEGHGFRTSANVKRAFDAELYFYGKVLGISLAKPFDTPPVEIIQP